MKYRLALAVGILMLCTKVVSAQGPDKTPSPSDFRWEILPGLQSAGLSSVSWLMVGSSGLSWPDGRQAVVTFWRSTGTKPLHIRCVANFDNVMRWTGEGCYQAVER